MAFDPIFRWLQDAIIPTNPVCLDSSQSAQYAYADDIAVAASSFRDLLTVLAPAFRSVDQIAGVTLKYRKCCWVQYGVERRDCLLDWLSDDCEVFRKRHMPSTRHIHRWTAPRKIIQRVLKNNASTKSLVERLCDFRIYAVSVLSYIGSICAPDKATLKAEDCTMLYLLACYALVLCGLGPDLVRSALRPALELPRFQTRSATPSANPRSS